MFCNYVPGLKKQDYVSANGNMLTGVYLTEWILKGIDLYSTHIQPNVAHSVQLKQLYFAVRVIWPKHVPLP